MTEFYYYSLLIPFSPGRVEEFFFLDRSDDANDDAGPESGPGTRGTLVIISSSPTFCVKYS